MAMIKLLILNLLQMSTTVKMVFNAKIDVEQTEYSRAKTGATL
jgi:hypothetical protein